MKIIIKIKRSAVALATMFCLFFTLLCLSGCEDFLTKDVPNQTSEEDWWKTKSQLNTALNNIYLIIPTGTIRFDSKDPTMAQGYAYSNQRVEMEGLTDNGVGSANYVSYDVFDRGAVPTNEDRTIKGTWINKWKGIRRCCRFLENYQRANISLNDKPAVERWAAEARANRAFFHLELFLFYGEIPIVETTTVPDEQNLGRRPKSDIVAWIAKELEECANILPQRGDTENGYSDSEKWRWTKGACHAWMSYLYLYVGDWANAKKWAEEVINSAAYKLFRSTSTPAESYSKLFLPAYSGEINNEPVFLKNVGMLQVHRRLAPISSNGGQTGLSPTASLVNTYELADGRTLDELSVAEREEYIKKPKYGQRDPRLTMSILFPNEKYLNTTPDPWGSVDAIGKVGSSKTGYWVKKWGSQQEWVTTTGDSNGKNDFFLMRYAVVLLNYVEAAIELNELSNPKIYEYLDDIRTRAGMPVVDRTKYNTQNKLRELVRRERRVELAFEGHRLFDIRRWRIAKDVMNGVVEGAFNPSTNNLHFTLNRTFNDRDYLWPIPAEEIINNTNPEMYQNPGY